jgi:hypothetical protein
MNNWDLLGILSQCFHRVTNVSGAERIVFNNDMSDLWNQTMKSLMESKDQGLLTREQLNGLEGWQFSKENNK